MDKGFEIARRFQFCAGHRVTGHESKCAHLHGHNYVAFVHCRARNLDKLGRVIDFGVIKEVVGKWIDENWDHGMILWKGDDAARAALCELIHYGEDPRLFMMKTIPTAENMAMYLKGVAERLLKGKVEVTKVVLWETENCFAEV